MATPTTAAGMERKIDTMGRQIERLTEQKSLLERAATQLGEYHELLPKTISPTMRMIMAWGTGAVTGTVNGLTDLPEAIAPAAAVVVGVGGQMADVSPDAAEAFNAVASGGGAVFTYVAFRRGARGAMDWIRGAAAETPTPETKP